jgi:hypothetical protein
MRSDEEMQIYCENLSALFQLFISLLLSYKQRFQILVCLIKRHGCAVGTAIGYGLEKLGLVATGG